MSAFIDENRERLGVEPICSVLEVSASAYYERAKGRRSAWEVSDERLLVEIKRIHSDNYEAYGSRRTWKGVIFFSFVIDVFSRKVVGWQLATNMRTDLVLDALRMALGLRSPGADVALVHHSDRGSQYTSAEFKRPACFSSAPTGPQERARIPVVRVLLCRKLLKKRDQRRLRTRVVPLAADLFEQFSNLSLAPVLLVVGASMGERGKGEVVLTGIDGNLGDGKLGIRARPLALPSLLREVDGTSQESQGEVVETKAIHCRTEIPREGGLAGVQAHGLAIERQHTVELAVREEALNCLSLRPLARSERVDQQLVGLADKLLSPSCDCGLCVLWLACIACVGHRSVPLAMRAIAWLALDCDARRGFPRQFGRDRRREAHRRSVGQRPLGRSSCAASSACAESFNGARQTK